MYESKTVTEATRTESASVQEVIEVLDARIEEMGSALDLLSTRLEAVMGPEDQPVSSESPSLSLDSTITARLHLLGEHVECQKDRIIRIMGRLRI